MLAWVGREKQRVGGRTGRGRGGAGRGGRVDGTGKKWRGRGRDGVEVVRGGVEHRVARTRGGDVTGCWVGSGDEEKRVRCWAR